MRTHITIARCRSRLFAAFLCFSLWMKYWSIGSSLISSVMCPSILGVGLKALLSTSLKFPLYQLLLLEDWILWSMEERQLWDPKGNWDALVEEFLGTLRCNDLFLSCRSVSQDLLICLDRFVLAVPVSAVVVVTALVRASESTWNGFRQNRSNLGNYHFDMSVK